MHVAPDGAHELPQRDSSVAAFPLSFLFLFPIYKGARILSGALHATIRWRNAQFRHNCTFEVQTDFSQILKDSDRLFLGILPLQKLVDRGISLDFPRTFLAMAYLY